MPHVHVLEYDEATGITRREYDAALRRAGLKDVCLEKYREASRMLAAGLRDAVSGRYRFCGGRLKAAQDIVQRNLIRETVRQEKQVIPCYAGKLTAVITETGEVYACESFSGKLGNLRAAGYDLQAVLAGKAAREKVASIERGECHCTHECYFIMNILFNPALYPALIREYLKL